jgi:hypothetical protein
MRVTRDLLLNLARDHTTKMVAKDRGLSCVYLSGSLLNENPFLGGVTDIDLFCVHDRPVPVAREILRINADVNLDIAHYTQDAFLPARKLRGDPWIGGALAQGPLLLYDALHWFDFTRSTATAQFWQADNLAQRARIFLGSARLNWQALQDETLPQGIKRVQALLDTIRDSANTAAVLTGTPLPIRRVFVDLPERSIKAGIPELAGQLVQVFTNESVTDENLVEWIKGWEASFNVLQETDKIPLGYDSGRLNYYLKAIKSLASEKPAAAVWILLRTWTKMATGLPKSELHYKLWQALCRQLELEARNLPTRLEQLDAALDVLEETVDHIQH